MIRLSTLLVAGCALAAFVLPSAAGTVMELTGNAFPPPAFKPFCASEPRLCSTNGSLKAMQLTAGLEAELNQVNREVNRRITERDDRAAAGKPDEWRLPNTTGDCEDFAILKKSELLKRGWPASTLLLTVARQGTEGHTVLTVRTSKGDLVLDNRTSSVLDWSRTPYRYFARQSQTDGKRWERIGAPRPL